MANHRPQSFYSLGTNFKYHMILPPVTIVVFPGMWELVRSFGIVPARYPPAPSALVATFSDEPVNPKSEGVTLIQNLVSSMQISFVGLLTTIVIGIPLGLLMGSCEPFDRFVKPVFEMVRPIPSIVWIPPTIVMLGAGSKAEVFIICFAAFVSCVINAYTDIKLTNPTLIQAARACGALNLQIFFRVCIPSSVQMVFVGVQIALSASWSTPVAAEMLTSSSGLEYMIQMGCLLAGPDLTVLGILIIGIIGFLLPALLTVLGQNLARWRVVRWQIRKTSFIV